MLFSFFWNKKESLFEFVALFITEVSFQSPVKLRDESGIMIAAGSAPSASRILVLATTKLPCDRSRRGISQKGRLDQHPWRSASNIFLYTADNVTQTTQQHSL